MVLRLFWDGLKLYLGGFKAVWDGFVVVSGWFCSSFCVLLRPGGHTFGRGATLFSYKHDYIYYL